MRRFLAIAAFLALAACAGLGPRAQLAAADTAFDTVVDRIDKSCVLKQIKAADCVDAQGYVRAGRAALDSAYNSLNATGGTGTYLDVLLSVTATLEGILATRAAQ